MFQVSGAETSSVPGLESVSPEHLGLVGSGDLDDDGDGSTSVVCSDSPVRSQSVKRDELERVPPVPAKKGAPISFVAFRHRP